MRQAISLTISKVRRRISPDVFSDTLQRRPAKHAGRLVTEDVACWRWSPAQHFRFFLGGVVHNSSGRIGCLAYLDGHFGQPLLKSQSNRWPNYVTLTAFSHCSAAAIHNSRHSRRRTYRFTHPAQHFHSLSLPDIHDLRHGAIGYPHLEPDIFSTCGSQKRNRAVHRFDHVVEHETFHNAPRRHVSPQRIVRVDEVRAVGRRIKRRFDDGDHARLVANDMLHAVRPPITPAYPHSPRRYAATLPASRSDKPAPPHSRASRNPPGFPAGTSNRRSRH